MYMHNVELLFVIIWLTSRCSVFISQEMIPTYTLSKYVDRTSDTASSVVTCRTTDPEVRGSNAITLRIIVTLLRYKNAGAHTERQGGTQRQFATNINNRTVNSPIKKWKSDIFIIFLSGVGRWGKIYGLFMMNDVTTMETMQNYLCYGYE